MKIAVFLLLGIFVALISLSSATTTEKTQVIETQSQETSLVAGGKDDNGKTYAEHKSSKKSGKKSKHDHENSKHGSDLSEKHRIEDSEKGGKKHKHVHADKHESFHKSGGESAQGAMFEEASKRHKGNFKKGFMEKFHKDEQIKHDSFFSKGEKSGSYNIFGKKGAKYGSNSISKKAGGAFKSLKSEGKHGKGGKKAGGHNKSEKKGHKNSKSAKSSYAKNEKFGRKGGKKERKQIKVKQ